MAKLISNKRIKLNMDYWYDIVKSYDNSESKNPGKIDDGTYSQFSVVTLLIYLSFGKDYPYNIAKFFRNYGGESIRKVHRSSTLRHAGKVGTLLKKMEEDKLVIFIEDIEEGNRGVPRKYYRINPAIFQSHIRDARDRSQKISLEEVESRLAFLEKINEDNAKRIYIFKVLRNSGLNFYHFIYYIFTYFIDYHLERDV